jgi:hypothetical protein
MTTVFHIGYHKTASTWLQGQVFPRLEGRSSMHEHRLADEALRNLARADDADFLPHTIQALRDEFLARERQPLLFSYEGLSGRLWRADDSGFRSIDRLAVVEPGARIFVVVREQRTMLRSVYFQYVYEGGTLDPTSFCADPSGPGWVFPPEHLCYDRLVGRAIEVFGADNVCVLPYELLTTRPQVFLDDLCAFFDASVDRSALNIEQRTHQSLSRSGLDLLVHWNRWFRSSQLDRKPAVVDLRVGHRVARPLRSHVDPLLRRLGSGHLELDIPESWRAMYAASNACLQPYVAHPLGDLGYVGVESSTTRA